MIFGLINQLKKKPREFNYRPITYDPDLKDFRDKVLERNNGKKFDFRRARQADNKKFLQKQLIRFAVIMFVLLTVAYYVFTSKSLDNFANWLVS